LRFEQDTFIVNQFDRYYTSPQIFTKLF